jgi:hypothetical protein
LNPNDAADGRRIAANGYSNLENYLNQLAGDYVAGLSRISAPSNLRILSTD